MLRKNLLCVILFFCVITTVTAKCEKAQVCVTDLQQSDCDPQTLVPNTNIFGCCPSCQTPSGLLPDPSGCRPPSNCLPDGRYAPVQCKGDQYTGRCFCSDENGKRIFGQMWRSDASDMSCACSRRRAELEAIGGRVVTLHCTQNGDYESLQCDDGMCWCAQPKTGFPTVVPVPEKDMTNLPCYSPLSTGEQYLRKCESLVLANARIQQEQSDHGTTFLGNPTTFCEYDGSYGPYKVVNGIAYCTDRDGEILGAWQVVSSDTAGMTCNCAQDTMIYFPERGLSVTEVCQANGNYRPNQNVGDVYYCVDKDGYSIELLDAWPTDNCASHA
ncbi:unnamed protein product [Chrysodeixis includens]|uniref:Thyroglobulin type-1 domain-containing protein n=1 Tax=Chrysodeixis includens TaxID=689277 RepID=A0A9N8KT27_CHRIL|nr:unnamed protein product [Chrysodeixis includens]